MVRRVGFGDGDDARQSVNGAGASPSSPQRTVKHRLARAVFLILWLAGSAVFVSHAVGEVFRLGLGGAGAAIIPWAVAALVGTVVVVAVFVRLIRGGAKRRRDGGYPSHFSEFGGDDRGGDD